MKKFFIVIAIVAVMLIGATVAFAATAKTPAEIVSGLTGKTVNQVVEARQNGKTYGTQAAEANKLKEFKEERLAQYKLALDERVKEKRITQEQADRLYDAMKARMENCTGDRIEMDKGNSCGIDNRNRAYRGNGIGRMDCGCENGCIR